MAEPITQEEIYRVTGTHLRATLPMLNRIGGCPGEEATAGYIDDEDKLTTRGVTVARTTQQVAHASASRLFELLHCRAVGGQDTELLRDAVDFFFVTVAAVEGSLGRPLFVADDALVAVWPEMESETIATSVLRALRSRLWTLLRVAGFRIEAIRGEEWGTVSAPIQAPSDDAAIFTLLSQVRGQMPLDQGGSE